MRAVAGASLTLAVGLVAWVPGATASVAPPLTGEHLEDLNFTTLSIAKSCNPSGTSTIQFTVSGPATGPYPGTFVETGTLTIGPQVNAPSAIYPSFSTGSILSYSATFSINSSLGQVDGSKEYRVDPGGRDFGICTTFADKDIPEFGVTDADGFLSFVAVYNLAYVATIVTGAETVMDAGTATSTVGDFSVRAGTRGFGGNDFVEDFVGEVDPNDSPSVEAGGPYAGDEGAAISLDGTVSDPDGDSLTTAWTYAPLSGVDAGATCSFGDASDVDTTFTCADDGSYTVTLTAADGTAEPVSDSATVVVSNVAPEVDVTAPAEGSLYPINTAVNVSAGLSDDGTNDTHTCSIDWDDATSSAGSVSESNGSGTCSGSHSYAAAGVYTIDVTVTDDDGDSATDSVMVVVYDPNGGFATGGGWIDSPAGALMADPYATGKASFGFVSKYKKGASVPDGNTEFQFQAGSLNFHSSSYQWLVVNSNGCRAQFKGSGTINGGGSYGFMLWAYDGDCTAEPGPDKFRITIWNGSDESDVVYDNGLAYPNGQPLGGGSVKIHITK